MQFIHPPQKDLFASLSALLIDLAISESEPVIHLQTRTGERCEFSRAKGLIRYAPNPDSQPN